jgi:flagellar biosynthesis protein FlhA
MKISGSSFSFGDIRLEAPLLVTGGLVLIVMLLVIPMPPVMLDCGIVVSIATAMLVLVMASLVERPTDFQAFPLLLLVSLVLRLALNISSTRLILTEGHQGPHAAGQIISGFADFVAGGSLLIGLTVFAVISVVNFMVITKGSGRMAEVAARFALDSLPGKQLAIDADLSSGAIDHQEAKRRRAAEQSEISFFGSLDGASKFVKGDAIAGIVITIINLLVGLAIGIISHGLPVGEALNTYSRLTIGDGLVSQIPALITSMAAAVLLSRGGATEPTSDLLSREFMRNWQPAVAVAASMVFMSLVPGMPKILFLGMAGGFAMLAFRISRKRRKQGQLLLHESKSEQSAPAAPKIGDVLDMDEINIEIGADLVLTALDQGRGLAGRINSLRVYIARTYGLILPDVRITDSPALSGGEYRILLQGVVRGRGDLHSDEVLALGNETLLDDVEGRKVLEPVYSTPARWVPKRKQDELAIQGLTIVSPMEILSTHLMEIVKANLPGLLTLAALQRQLEELKSVSDPVRAERNRRHLEGIVPDKVPPETLLAVLRALLEERISIRNLLLIVDTLCEVRQIESVEAVYELVRKRLRGQITQQHMDDDGAIHALQLHPSWEAEFVKAESEQGRTSRLASAPMLSQRLADSCKKAMAAAGRQPTVVLITPDHRRRLVRTILVASDISVPVLGIDEIDPDARVQFAGVIEAA